MPVSIYHRTPDECAHDGLWIRHGPIWEQALRYGVFFCTQCGLERERKPEAQVSPEERYRDRVIFLRWFARRGHSRMKGRRPSRHWTLGPMYLFPWTLPGRLFRS